MRGTGPLLAILGVLSLVLAGLLVFLLIQPAEVVETIEVERFRNHADFSYTASMDPSIIYNHSTIRPAGDGTVTPPLYTELLQSLAVDFAYAFESADAAADIAGVVSAHLRIRAGEKGWIRELELLPAQEFRGETTSTSFEIEWPTVSNLIVTAEEQAGLSPAQYDLAVVAEVSLTGDATEGVDDQFVAELPMTLTSTELVIDEERLSIIEPVTEPRQVLVANDIAVLGLSLPVMPSRVLTGSLLALILLGGGIYLLVLRDRLGSGEAARIHLLYGSLIIPAANIPSSDRSIEIASMADLVRLARKSEQMVFHYQPEPGHDLFYVPDGAVTYKYQIEPAGRSSR